MTDEILSADIIIVNLSAMHKLKSILAVLNKFATLHKNNSTSWSKNRLYSYLWVSWKYLFLRRDINEYKLGNINTDQFIDKLFDIFYFLNRGLEHKKLLEDAWNSLIIVDESSKTKLQYLIRLDKPVYFISNSNYLNIDKIVSEFNKLLTEKWRLPEEKDIKDENFRSINIGGKFYMALSFQCSSFKQDTPGLIDKLVNSIKLEKSKISLISQYPKDLEKAAKIGIKNMNSHDCFDDSSQDHKKSEEVIDQDTNNSFVSIPYEEITKNTSIKKALHSKNFKLLAPPSQAKFSKQFIRR